MNAPSSDLSDGQRAQVQRVLTAFYRTRSRTEPVLEFVNGDVLTAGAIVKGLASSDSSVSKHIFGMIGTYVASGQATLDEILADFTGDKGIA